MLKCLQLTVLGLIALLFSFTVQAQFCPTYAGGEFSYKSLGHNKYVLTLTVYRNCSSCTSTLPGSISVTSPPNGCSSSYTYYTLTNTNTCVDVTPIPAGCTDSSICKGGTLPGTQRCTFTDTITLPCADSNWTFYATMYYLDTTTNVSGSFNYFSPHCTINNFNYGTANTVSNAPVYTDMNDVYYVCPGHTASFSLGGYDPDGDSLGYSVITPFSFWSPFFTTVVTYNSGFTSTSPLDATCMGIDSTTGQVTFHPTTNESTEMAVVVTKYRRINGVLHVIGTIYRTIQIRVLSSTQCNSNRTPIMARPVNISGGTLMAVANGCDSGYYFNVCPGYALSFKLPCLDSDKTQTLTASTDAGGEFTTSTVSIVNGSSGANSKNVSFSWTPSNNNIGFYVLTITLRDNNCPYNAIRTYSIGITVKQPTYAGRDTTICKGQKVTLNGLGGSTFSWTSSSSGTATTTQSITVSPTVTTSYYLSSNNTSCKTKDTIVVYVTPAFKLSMAPSNDSICLNQVSNITVSTNTAGTFTYYWTSGDRFKTTPSVTDSTVGAWPLNSSVYYVRVVKSGGCTEVDSILVTIKGVAPPVHASVLPRRILCTGDSIQLNAFTPVSNSTYCTPTTPSFGCSTFGAIDSCILGSVTFFKGVGCTGGYNNLGLLNTTCFNTGSTYLLQLGTSGSFKASYAAWIDWNHDGVFQNNECVFMTGNNCSPYIHTKSVTVPAGAVPGRTKVRIMASYCFYTIDSTMSCGATGNASYYGEVKDLDIMVCNSSITYAWSPSGSVTNSAVQNPKAFPTTTTTYTVTATAGGSCSNSDTVSVTVVPTFTLTVSPLADTICYLRSVSLTSGTSPGSISTTTSWLAGSENGTTVSTSSGYTATPKMSTKYFAKAVSTEGCTKFDSVNIIVLPSPALHASATPDTICLGDSVKLSAFSVNSMCTYCTAHPLSTFCYNGYMLDSLTMATLQYADVGCGGLSNGYAYFSNPVPTLNIGGTYTMKVKPNPGGYQMHLGVWIDFNHNCSLTDTGELVYTSTTAVSGTTYITIPIPLSAIPGKTRMRVRYEYYYNFPYAPYQLSDACDTTSTSSGSTFSEGEVLDFDVNLYAPISYVWSPGTNPSTGVTVSAAPTTTTIYTVTYKNGTSCSARDSVKVVVVPNFTISATPKSDTICYGHNDTLRGSVIISGYPFTINWLSGSRAGSVVATTGLVPISLPSSDQKYILRVHAGSGCTKYDSAYIHVAPAPVLNPCATPDTICLGDSVTLKAFCSSSSCVYCPAHPITNFCFSSYLLDSLRFGNLFYVDSGCGSLNHGYKLVSPATLPTINIGGTYNIKVVPNPFGFEEHLAIWIDYNHDCSFMSDTSELLYSSQTAVSGALTIPVTIPVKAIPGKSRLRVMYVYYSNFPYAPLVQSDCCDTTSTSSGNFFSYGEVVDFDINLYAPIVYTWSPATHPVHAANTKAAPTTTTTYTVSYRNGTSCSASSTIAVTVVPNFTATVTPHIDTICYGRTDTLKLAVLPTSTTYTASWYANSALTGTYLSSGNKYPSVPGVSHSKYICKVASTSGCTKYDSAQITVLPSPVLHPTAFRDTICAGDSVTLNAFASSSSTCRYCSAASYYCYSFYASDSMYLGGYGYATPCSTSGTTGYLQFTSPVPTLSIGGTYTLKIKMPNAYNIGVWVDWNHNCSFLDTMEFVYNTATCSVGINNITITVPLGALPGKTRMRIYTGYDFAGLSQSDACDSGLSTMYGQFVDLDVNLYAPIIYNWSPTTNPAHAALTKAAPTITTTYTVSYQNGSSCNSSATIQVVVTPNYTTTVTPRYDSVCYGSSRSITATASSSGATTTWYVGDTTTGILSTGSPYVATPTVARTKYIVLFDLGGCHKEDSSIIKVLPAPVLGPTATPKVICLGDSTLLSAFAISTPNCFCPAWASLGCAGYYVDTFMIDTTHMVSKSGCNTGNHSYYFYSTPTFTAQLGTSYTFHLALSNAFQYCAVWIDFDHSCSFDPGELVYSNASTGNSAFTFTVPIPMGAVPGKTRIRVRTGYCLSCSGGGIPANYGCDTTGMYEGETDDFSLYLTAKGLTYSWAPVTHVANPTQAITKAAPVVTTTYTVSYSSSGICTGSDTVSVRVVPNYTVSVTPQNDSFCTAGTMHTPSSTTVALTASITPASAGPFLFKWCLNDTSSPPLDTTSLTYNASTATSGKYYIKVRSDSGQGCFKLDSTNVNILPFINVRATVSPNLICPGSYTALNAFAVSASTGYCTAKTQFGCNYYTFYTYTYAIDSFYFAGIIKNPGTGCNKKPGGYKYMGAYTGTCLNAGNTYHIAFGMGGILSGTFHFYVNNYAVWIDYNHNGTFEASECVLIYNNTASPYNLKGTVTIPVYALPGNTRMRVRSSNGGAFSPEPLNANLGCDTASINYGSVQDYDICIDNSYLKYTWTPGTGVDSATSPSTQALVTATTTYTVTLSGYSGYCQSSDTASVKTPTGAVEAGVDTAVCAGNGVILTGTITGTGMAKWTGVNPSDNSTITSPTSLSTAVTPTATTSYVLTDSFTTSTLTCLLTDTVTVLYDNPVPFTLRRDTQTCAGNCINVTAPAGYARYVWSPAALFTNPDSAHQKICLTSTAEIRLTTYDKHGCSTYDTFKFTVLPVIHPAAHSDTCICPGGIATLNGGTGAAWSWAPATALSGLSTRVVRASPTTATIYTLTVTDVNGCKYDTTLSVCVYPGVRAATSVADTILVYGTSGQLHASGGATYYWTPNVDISSMYTQNPVVSPTVTTTYYVLVTDSNTCTGTASVIVNVTSKCLGLYMASAFSPNSADGNAYAAIQGVGFDELVDCSIFNRWGQLMFQTSNKNDKWDGTLNGLPAQMGTYIYIIKSKCDGHIIERKGNITLLR